MSPPAFRATFPGVAYQVGNVGSVFLSFGLILFLQMVSSASAQIEATGGEQLRTTITVNGEEKNVPDYATVSHQTGTSSDFDVGSRSRVF